MLTPQQRDSLQRYRAVFAACMRRDEGASPLESAEASNYEQIADDFAVGSVEGTVDSSETTCSGRRFGGIGRARVGSRSMHAWKSSSG